MIARKSGCFVNIASVARLFPYNWAGSYSVVKAGLIMLTRLMALEWTPPYGIRANAIAPGYIRTLGTEGMYAVITSACRDAASPAAASTERRGERDQRQRGARAYPSRAPRSACGS